MKRKHNFKFLLYATLLFQIACFMNERKVSFQKEKGLSYLFLSYLNTPIITGARQSIDQFLKLRFAVFRTIRFKLNFTVLSITTKVIHVGNTLAFARAFIASHWKPVSNKKYPNNRINRF